MATVDGHNLTEGRITMPRIGAWHAELQVDHNEALSGSVTIEIEGAQWVGTVVRAGVDGGRSLVRVVGGGGGLATVLASKSYQGPAPIRPVLNDWLTETGESLSSSVASALLDHMMPAQGWQRTKGIASHALVKICDELGVDWRILADGTLWIGAETWADAELTDPKILDEDWQRGVFTVANAIALTPGTVFNGEQIHEVTHWLTGSSLRTEARLTAGNALFDRLLERVRRDSDYAKLWPARVEAQRGDGTLDVEIEHERFKAASKGRGFSGIPIRHGLPGISVQVAQGCRVLVGFEAADPKRPYAALWENQSAVTAVVFDSGTKGVARVDDTVDAGELYVDVTVPTTAVLYYTAPGTPRVWLPVIAAPSAPIPATIGTPIQAKITSGNSKLKA